MAPFRQRTIYEVNADLSFYQLNGDVPMQWSKHSEKGSEERRALLEQKIPGVQRILDAEVPGATPSHLLDAAVDPLDGPEDLCQGRQSASRPTPSGTSRACGWRSFVKSWHEVRSTPIPDSESSSA